MKICFFGLGSIGKKHLVNLKKVCEEREYSLEVHAYRSLKNTNRLDGIDKEIYNLSDLDSDYDVIFITNPNSMHFDTIKYMKDKGKNFFIEKPLFDNTSYSIEEFEKFEGIMYVAAPLRHTGIVEKLKELIKDKKVYSVRAICSSYLPEWRPNQDYREVYSAKKELGGGVSIDLIHEWDYLTHLFGFPDKVVNFQGKYSHLEINSEDLSVYIGEYKNKIIELHLDYIGRFPKREVEIYTANELIIGDFINKKVFIKNREKIIENDFSENNDMYIEEMRNFLDMISGKKINSNSIEHAFNVLKLIKESEKQ